MFDTDHDAANRAAVAGDHLDLAVHGPKNALDKVGKGAAGVPPPSRGRSR